MKLQYHLTEQDYIDFNLNFFQNSPTMKKSVLKGRIAAPIIFVIAPFLVPSSSSLNPTIGKIIFFTMAVLWGAFYPAMIKKGFVRNIHKTLQEKSNNFLGDKTLELTPGGILTKGSHEEVLTAYDSIIDVQESGESVYLYTSSVSAIIISPSAFNTKESRQEFLSSLKNYLPSSPAPQNISPAKSGIFDKLDKL